MLLQEFGEDLVFALQLGFELLDLALLGVLDGLGLAVVLKNGVAVLEELLLPAVEEIVLPQSNLENRSVWVSLT